MQWEVLKILLGVMWKVNSQRQMLTCMDNCQGMNNNRQINQPGHPVCHIEGVSILLESHPGNEMTFPTERTFIYANQKLIKHFPIPEAFWPLSFRKEGGGFSKFVNFC
jgi:hypothetical protein